MYTSKIKSHYIKFRKQRLCQGDILQNISFTIRLNGVSDEEDMAVLPYAVVLSQDCDVDLDHKMRLKEKELLKTFNFEEHSDRFRSIHDKFLPTILVCPAYRADDFFAGNHIKGLYMKSNNKPEADKIKNNKEMSRYHYLPQDTNMGVTDLVLDFKHFFTIPTDILYEQRKDSYLITINELFRESLSQRFANYLSRFGLPFDPNKVM